ncbi:MAG TPA: peptidoglycan glycosyltransferase [Candidatus Eisenbergiella merdigallinarum]|uniref:Peptidoglycan glycosyltransferase n=1 Tax=Candidatus Eisenbergiella merdigallinarum TaxID=2838552 RepID=A0A9D2MRH2_9FIRM|nr:peptidoglycan glycosyltransferase [Candidatus Eisenbergiella merdigallinarum]
MEKSRTFHRKKIVVAFFLCLALFLGLTARVVYLMVFRSEHYAEMAEDLHQRERKIKARRGRILDRNGEVLADNRTVCTISVIHSQIREPEKVIEVLARELEMEEEEVRKRVEKVSSIEKIRSNVEKETGDAIRAYGLAGVKVDEDYKRYYPWSELASKVLGFTGADNQGILALESYYESWLEGEPGIILETTDARGVQIEGEGEKRVEPVSGDDLCISLDRNIQQYATQLAVQVKKAKEADSVSILVMRPDNGEILALADVPEYDLNDPFTLPEGAVPATEEERQDLLNRMWRNACISDTYEPGSAFKIITASAALEEGVVTEEDTFQCPGYIVVDDRKIRCAKVQGHGTETFVQGTMNSCNPVFVTVGLRLGTNRYYHYFEQFGLKKKTGIDLPGEAGTIMHREEDMGPVELATVSFGQSFQITPIQLATTVSSLINGGKRITPHFGLKTLNEEGKVTHTFTWPAEKGIVSEDTSSRMREILFQVVENGGGQNGKVEGYRVGGKTATSETLPRGTGRYISSFLGFAPAQDPKVLALCIIRNPQGVYYGGQVAAPVIRQLFENILPYLEEKEYNEK